MLPTPILLACTEMDAINHQVVFVNRAFIDMFGWTHNDIVNKQQWWQMAYPDNDYRHAVERQWELAVESAKEQGEVHIAMPVNIMTKDKGLQRFYVSSPLTPVFTKYIYPVLFEPCD